MFSFFSKSSKTGIRKRPSLDFSLTGLIYCLMMMFMGIAAIQSSANLLFGVFGLMIGILIIAGLLSKRVLRKLTVRRVLPDHAVVGLPATLIYQFANGKRYWPSLSVTVSELDGAEGFTKQPQSYMLHAAAGMTASVPTEVIPRQRGLHFLKRFQISTSFPFGFVKRAITAEQADRLLVYPALGQVDRALLAHCRAAETTGASMRPRQGGQDEFYGVKEHRPGDNPRHIYWKRSARTAATGLLIAREMTQVAPPRLLLLVDTWQTDTSSEEVARVERAIAMAASFASFAIENELSVGLLAWSKDWKRLDPSSGKRQRGELLSMLARLPRNVTHDTSQLLDQGMRHLRNGTTAIFFTPRAMPAGLDARSRGAVVMVPTDSVEASQWFRFDAAIDFAKCAPPAEPPAK